ncbi:MAG: acyl-CoA dehydrogenase family protein [Acidimicrobiia bacterium]|jgi:alkylation response protein AidB-like acyl-CoA dehydrogenase
MDLGFSAEDERFRDEVRTFLEESLAGDFAVVRGRGGPGDDDCLFEERLAWERHLAAHGWTCVAWPTEHGGRGLSLHQQVIYFEEYARARAPGRVGHIGETLLGPTLIAFGTPEQQARFLPGIVAGTELWCQGYSEPEAGSDLANLQTRAELVDGEWVIDGQKVWTSQAHWSDWCFVLARTDRTAPKHKGISYLLVPMRQDGIEIRPIHQLTGDSEFNEVFFSRARTAADNVVGEPEAGWKVAMGTLAFERGASTLGQNLMFLNEWDEVVAAARANGRIDDPVVRQRLAETWGRLRLMRLNALRIMSSTLEAPPAAMVTKLFWATLHRDLGELAMDVLGAEATLRSATLPDGSADLTRLQRLFLFSRADTIYAGTNEIQRNLIGERALGLPKEPSP